MNDKAPAGYGLDLSESYNRHVRRTRRKRLLQLVASLTLTCLLGLSIGAVLTVLLLRFFL